MTLMESIRTFISTCPYLPELSKGININYLSTDIYSFSIEEADKELVIKRYVDGSSIRQFTFILTSCESYEEDIVKNMEKSRFYEDFTQWLEGQSLMRNLPVMSEGKEAKKIEALSNGYVFEIKQDKAQYKIKCKLTYYQKGGI